MSEVHLGACSAIDSKSGYYESLMDGYRKKSAWIQNRKVTHLNGQENAVQHASSLYTCIALTVILILACTIITPALAGGIFI